MTAEIKASLSVSQFLFFCLVTTAQNKGLLSVSQFSCFSIQKWLQKSKLYCQSVSLLFFFPIQKQFIETKALLSINNFFKIIIQERLQKSKLEGDIQDLRADNVRLQEESQTAAAQLRRFTEWFFNTIDRQ